MDYNIAEQEMGAGCNALKDDQERFILTGTRAYGPVGEDSDYDIVAKVDDARVLFNFLEFMKVEIHDSSHIDPSYQGYYFRLNNLDKVQIIVAADDVEFRAWKKATKLMKLKPPIEDRTERVEKFRGLFFKCLGEEVE